MGKSIEDANTYRVGHPLAQRVLQQGMALSPLPAEVTFDLSGSGKNIAILVPFLGESGWLSCSRLTMSALETEDQLILCAMTDEEDFLDDSQCRRFFDLPAVVGEDCSVPILVTEKLEQALTLRRQELIDEMTARNAHWFDTEMEKLDKWADDRRTSLKVELAELDEMLKEAKKAARLAPTLPDKLERQRAVRTLETKRDEAWRAYDQASREVDRQKDALLDEISRRLEQKFEIQSLFTIRWEVN
jgi:hypothetical protein